MGNEGAANGVGRVALRFLALVVVAVIAAKLWQGQQAQEELRVRRQLEESREVNEQAKKLMGEK